MSSKLEALKKAKKVTNVKSLKKPVQEETLAQAIDDKTIKDLRESITTVLPELKELCDTWNSWKFEFKNVEHFNLSYWRETLEGVIEKLERET
jgi:hypothetical protein